MIGKKEKLTGGRPSAGRSTASASPETSLQLGSKAQDAGRREKGTSKG